MKYIIGFILGCVVTSIFFMYQLKKRQAQSTTPTEATEGYTYEADGLPSDFLSFYQKFHNDTTYQLAHVLFPLQGIPSQTDSSKIVDDSFRWQKEDWQYHQPFENVEGQFSRSYEKVSEDLIIENIRMVNAPFGMQRRFSRSNDEWYLIYYVSMNRLREE